MSAGRLEARCLIGVALLAAVLVGCGGSSHSAAGGSRQQLIRLLGALRRPQTQSDRDPAFLRAVERLSRSGLAARLGSRPDLGLIRLATIAPWGAKLFLVPFTAATSEPHCTGTERACAHVPFEETVGVFPLGVSDAFTAATIKDGVSLAGAPVIGRWAALVPDGVSRVTFLWPRKDPVTGAIYRDALRLTAAVRGNVAAVQSHRDESVQAVTWYGAGGRVLRRFG